MVDIAKRPFIAQEIVFLDGLTGTGKTMMGPILGSFRRVELGRLEHIYEYLCALNDLKKIDPDAAAFMINLYADLAIYNSMIARETNFRPSDLSGIFSNPHSFEYVKRLFSKDGNVVLERIKQSKPVLQIISHQALGVMDLSFQAFGERLKVVEMVRHPLYLLEHWHSYIDRHGADCRDFTVWIHHKGQALPWFAHGWEEKYIKSSSMDKVIYSIEWLTKKVDQMINALSEAQREQVLTIPFEKFVLGPDPYIEGIARLLNTEPTRTTQKILKEQRCPRRQVTAGPGKDIYKRYGWKRPDPRSNDREEFQKKRAFAEDQASKEALQALDRISQEYEEKHGLWF